MGTHLVTGGQLQFAGLSAETLWRAGDTMLIRPSIFMYLDEHGHPSVEGSGLETAMGVPGFSWCAMQACERTILNKKAFLYWLEWLDFPC